MSAYKRIANGTSAAVLVLSSLMSLGFTGVAHAAAQTCLWTGGGTDNKFSTVANWSNCGGTTPGAGDIIKFSTAPSGTNHTATLTNDLGVALGGVIDGYDTTSGVYNIDTISLQDGSVMGNATLPDCTHFHQFVTFNNVSSTGSITDNAGMIGAGTLTVGGNLTIDYGALNVQSGSSVAGNLTVTPYVSTLASGCGGMGAGGSASGFTGFTPQALIVQNGAEASLGSTSYPITLGGGSGTGVPTLWYDSNYSSNTVSPITYTLSSPITLLSNANITLSQSVTVNVTGSITGSNFALQRDPNSDHSGVLNIQPSSNSSATQTGLLTNPATTQTISDSQPSGSVTVVDNETLVFDGTRNSISVNSGGTLKGNGTTDNLYTQNGSIVAPGHSPGKLTVTAYMYLSGGTTYQAELKDTAAGDYDQIVVGDPSQTTGTVVALGDSNLNSYPTLDVQLYTGYNIKAGDQFTILDNKSGTAVSGQFNNLPEGATFNGPNGSVFKVSYKGGDGNDVVLTAVTAPKAPDTGFATISSHPAVTLGMTAAAAGFIAMVAKTNKRKLAPARARASKRRK